MSFPRFGIVEYKTSDGITSRDASKVKLPPRLFLYTLDQVAYCISVSEVTLKKRFLYLEGRSMGVHRSGLIMCRNIAEPDVRPDWRVAENELIRWMKFKGFLFSESIRLLK